MSEVWTEKYRPRRLKDVIGHHHLCKYLSRTLSAPPASRPHLLFHGPPGTGKTTLAYAYTYEMYPPNKSLLSTMYLNASDERTIEVIRERIIDFAKTSWPGIDRKIIIFDEVETMTESAQIALRALLDEYDENPTKAPQFIFLCNCLSRVQNLIRSRCVCFYMNALAPKSMRSLLVEISKKENIPESRIPSNLALYLTRGDMRQIVIQYQNRNQIEKKLEHIIRLFNSPLSRLDFILDEVLEYMPQGVFLLNLLTILRWLGWEQNEKVFIEFLNDCSACSQNPYDTSLLKDALKKLFKNYHAKDIKVEAGDLKE